MFPRNNIFTLISLSPYNKVCDFAILGTLQFQFLLVVGGYRQMCIIYRISSELVRKDSILILFTFKKLKNIY